MSEWLQRQHGWILLLAAIAAGGVRAEGQMPDPSQMAAGTLPAPRIEPGELPRACTSSNAYKTESPAVAQAFGPMWGTLIHWAVLHLQYPDFATGKRCADWSFILQKFQAAVANPVTGVVSDADVARIKAEFAKNRPAFQAAYRQFEEQQVGPQRAQRQADAADAARVAQSRATAPTIFGIPFGVPLDLPACGPGGSDRYPATCQSRNVSPFGKESTTIFFSKADRPGWIRNWWLDVELVDGNVMGLGFEPFSLAAATKAFDERFGAATVDEVPMHNDLGGRWAATRKVWRRDGLVTMITCGFERMGSCDTRLSIRSEAMTEARQRKQERQVDESLQKGRKL